MRRFNIYEMIEKDLRKEKKVITKALRKAIRYEKVKDIYFDVIIVDNNYIQEINKKYRNIDKPTDVISFALEDDSRGEYTKTRYLGDIYISYDKALEQSISYCHSLNRELSFLAVHGFLHLLGYDHMNLEEEKIMSGKQELILDGKK